MQHWNIAVFAQKSFVNLDLKHSKNIRIQEPEIAYVHQAFLQLSELQEIFWLCPNSDIYVKIDIFQLKNQKIIPNLSPVLVYQ